MRYLNRLRLQRAQSLLRASSASISSIAADCGFQSQAYFNRVFKQAFAHSPGAFRQQR
jgi:transcriptional regulator GlxA family with amidase domain